MNRKLIVSALAVVSLVILFIPWRNAVIAPAIRVRVLDEVGQPASGVLVVQEWEYRVPGAQERSESATADAEGYAAFPERSERISLGQQALSIGREIVHLPHGYGIGAYTRVSAYGHDPHVWYFVYCTPKDPPCDLIKLQRWDVTMYPRT